MSKSPHNLWTTGEARLLARLYPSRIPTAALYASFPRHSPRSVQAYAQKVLKVSRAPRRKGQFATPAWDRMREMLAREALTAGQLVQRLGVTQQRVSELLAEHRVEIYVAHWVPPEGRGHWRMAWALGDQPDAKPPFKSRTEAARAEQAIQSRNPFLAAAGMVKAPTGAPGRIFQQPMSIAEDEVAA